MKRNGVKAAKALLCMMLCITCLSEGCASKTGEIGDTTQTIKEIREEKEVLTQKWIQPSSEIRELAGWEVVEYVPDATGLADDTEIDATFVSSDEKSIYSLARYERNDSDTITYGYWWKRYDLMTMECREKTQLFSEKDFEGLFDPSLSTEISKKVRDGYARVTSVCVSGGKNIVFLTVWNETWEIQHFYMLTISEEGRTEEAKDYADLVWPDAKDRLGRFDVPEACRGDDGTVFLLSSQALRIFGEDGEDAHDFDLSGLGAENIWYAGKSREGIPVFCAWLQKSEKVFFCARGEKIQYLWSGKLDATTCRLDQYGYVLMLQNERLMTWNVLDGEVSSLYQFTGLSGFSCADIARNENGEIIAWYGRRGESGFAYRLNDSEHPDMKELVLLQDFQDQYTAKCAADYTRTHPGVKIRVEQMGDTGEMQWNKLGVEIEGGQGPDLILANRQQISILRDAGGLTDLTDLIPNDIKNNLFSGALKFGVFEERIYALPYEASLGTWMIRSDLLPDGDWDLTGVMNAFEEWKKREPNAERFEGLYFNASSTQLLYDLCLQDLENCELIDFGMGKCYFKSDTFRRLLRFCRDNGENMDTDHYLTKDEMVEEMTTGKTFLYYMGGGLIEYSNARSALGDQYVTIGYPSDKKVSGMIHCYRGVAVNERSKNKDLAVDFLLSMVSEESQVNYTTYWIRKDILKKRVENDGGDEEGPFFKMYGRERIPLKGKKDGTSYLNEYLTLMDEGKPLTIQYGIRDIVIEEAVSYFAGDKKEGEVADIIQKRVQNYLNEQ